MTACNYCNHIAPRATECICRIPHVEEFLGVLKAIDRVKSKEIEIASVMRHRRTARHRTAS